MTITLTYAWWWIPTAITLAAVLWAIVEGGKESGYFSGIAMLFMLVPALFVSCVAWIIAGVMK